MRFKAIVPLSGYVDIPTEEQSDYGAFKCEIGISVKMEHIELATLGRPFEQAVVQIALDA